MKVNYYYSVRVLENGGYDENDDLLHLCRACAQQYAADVQWASRGDDESECEFCGATNNPERTAHLDALFAEFTHV